MIEQKLSEILFDGRNSDALYKTIRASQEQRLDIHRITGGGPTYVNILRTDDDIRCNRNAGAADTNAEARLPNVAPAKPDQTKSARSAQGRRFDILLRQAARE